MADKGQAQYCIAHPRYFDVPERIPDAATWFAASKAPPPDGWVRGQAGLSVTLRPEHLPLPEQGWKVHVSATLDDAERVVGLVRDFCVANLVAFKFVRSRAATLALNSKYWPRNASGKLLTLYPRNTEQLTFVLERLGAQLSGVVGPYILSDLRYGEGPLFVRYGAFKELWHRLPNGSRVLGIRRPDGHTVPDVRGVTFTIPDFVEIPSVIRPFVDDPPGHSDDFPYTFERALHFSNGGGVYAARREGADDVVVLREARPHAGLDGRGRDATTRLRNERDILQRLSGLSCVPGFLEYITAWEHEYLALEYVPGLTLLDEIIRRYPLVHPDPSPEELSAYVAWSADIGERLERAVHDIHRRGVAVADLHPSNIMLRPNGELVIVDFETSTIFDGATSPGLGAPGFVAPSGLPAEWADWFAFHRVQLMTLMPIVTITGLAPEKAETLVTAVAQHLPVDVTALRVGLGSPPATDDAARTFADGDWTSIRRQMIEAILGTATPDRKDRLFPGDPLQFSFGGATLAYGAAGVLTALARAGAMVPDEFVDWLTDAARTPAGCAGVGMYDGPHGVAWALESLGRRGAALDVLAHAQLPDPDGGWGLFGGCAGAVLNCLHFARLTGRDDLHAAATEAGSLIRRRILDAESPRAGRAGLFHGQTGPALMCIRLFEDSGNDAYLDAAELALMHDLSTGQLLPDGTYHLRSGNRRLAYLDGGSTGVALVLSRFLRHREHAEFSRVLAAIHRSCEIPFVLHPGLFQGRAGLIATLAETATPGSPAELIVREQVRRLGWHAVADDGIAFPGSGLIRLSNDLATGTAGVLIALCAAFGSGPISLPFLTDACYVPLDP